jgi:hypothetical protein
MKCLHREHLNFKYQTTRQNNLLKGLVCAFEFHIQAKVTASWFSCLADHGLGTTAMNHKFRQNKRSDRGPMRGELWGLGPMAGGGVGGATCIITQLAGHEVSSAPGPRAGYRLFR